jgi:hypothetical protein
MNLLEPVVQTGLEQLFLAQQLTSLRSIRLHESSIAPTTLAKILAWTPALTHLEYDYYLHYNSCLNCEELDVAIHKVKDTLEFLSFACHVYSGGYAFLEETEDPYVVGRCTLVDLPNLLSLHISPCVLLGWDSEGAPPLDTILPSTLAHLCFHDELNFFDIFQWQAPALLNHLSELLASKRSRDQSPSLRSISIVNTGGWIWGDSLIAFETLSQQEGISCSLISAPDTSCSPTTSYANT